MATAETTHPVPQPTDLSTLKAAQEYLILQDWDAYTPEQHAIWQELVERRMPQLGEHACREYLEGSSRLGCEDDGCRSWRR